MLVKFKHAKFNTQNLQNADFTYGVHNLAIIFIHTKKKKERNMHFVCSDLSRRTILNFEI